MEVGSRLHERHQGKKKKKMLRSTYFLACVTCLLLSMVPFSDALSPEQVQMLQLFYNTTGGPSWANNDGWRTPFALWVNPCNATAPQPRLFGVTCGVNQIQVLLLESNNLAGTIPPAFFLTFPSLTTVQLLSNPKLGGSIPDFVLGAPLSNLLLQQCSFTGSIPASVFTSSLVQLQLELNQLTGGMPSDIGNSTQLSIFEVGQNKLSIGDFPPSVINCTAMTKFSVINSGVTSLPDAFSTLRGITLLNLQGNRLSGSVPYSWCSLTNLASIYLQDNNGLTGTIPDCIGNWTGLKDLVIENTQMSGTIPSTIFTAFPNLQQLALSGSKFSGVIPNRFGSIPNLQHAEFNGNNVNGDPVYTGPFPDSLLKLEFLQTLSIQYTEVEGPTTSFSELGQLQSLTLSSNPKMTMAFPSEILTSLWNSRTFDQGVQRALLIADMPLSGTLPQITNDVFNMSTQGGINFAQTDLTGYIPNSTLTWVPSASAPGLLAHCSQLLFPVAPWMLPLTNNYQGMQFTLGGLYNGVAVFPMSGGTEMGITGQGFVNIDGRFFCGFCVTGDAAVCGGDVHDMSDAVRNANFAFTPANQSLPGVMFCHTPPVPHNYTVSVDIFYIGPAYGDVTEYYRVSSSAVNIHFYNPTPTLTELLPSSGRPEGCSTIYARGRGFLNAPNVTLRIANAIWAPRGVVLNDTTVMFVIPSANASAINAKYPFDLNTTLHVDLFPAGGTVPQEIAVSSATYAFESTCLTPLVICANGFHDPESCPSAPLCRCFAEGSCVWANMSSFSSESEGFRTQSNFSFRCECAGGFNGEACEECKPGYYGPSCSKCACVHGACMDGIDADGSCACDSAYIGSTCAISKLGLGVGIPVAALVVGVAAFLLKRRFGPHHVDDNIPMNSEPRGKAAGGYGGTLLPT